jgi:hypothetical protein
MKRRKVIAQIHVDGGKWRKDKSELLHQAIAASSLASVPVAKMSG